MKISPPTLEGNLVRLEPLAWEHMPALAHVAIANPEMWRWTNSIIHSEADMCRYMQTAFALQDAGLCIPFATISKRNGAAVGSTRFMEISAPNRALEIGGTWLDPACQRTGINVEAKYLMLRHAFESMGCLRVCWKTHHKNLRSQAAIRALGAVEEGTFRNHMVHHDGEPRHSMWFSVIAEEWPTVKLRLEERMARHSG